VRDYTYQHFISSHYKTQLAAYLKDNICTLCGKEQKFRNVLRHVAMVHGILDKLLPEEIRRLYPKKRDLAARSREKSLASSEEDLWEEMVDDVSSITTEEEEEEMKIDVRDHFQVRYRYVLDMRIFSPYLLAFHGIP